MRSLSVSTTGSSPSIRLPMATAVTLGLSQMSWLRGWAAQYSPGEAPTLVQAGDFRRTYIDALRAADRNDIQPLLTFART